MTDLDRLAELAESKYPEGSRSRRHDRDDYLDRLEAIAPELIAVARAAEGHHHLHCGAHPNRAQCELCDAADALDAKLAEVLGHD